MISSTRNEASGVWQLIKSKIDDYNMLIKFRLNLTVVFSAVFGYLLATGLSFDWFTLFVLSAGGFLVTAAANAINQIFEKDYDKLMKRTANRPLATDRMSVTEAILVAGITAALGTFLLGYYINPLAGWIGAISLISYAFIYTPLKRMSTIAVLVGAIPGALPPVIGWVAATGSLGVETMILFAIQFLWQFPHFWAIGWLGYEDYKKAGFKLLPIDVDGRNKKTAIYINLYIVGLITVSVLPYLWNITGAIALTVSIIMGMFFLYNGIILFKKCDDKSALRVMFASLLYLPIVQIVMILDKV